MDKVETLSVGIALAITFAVLSGLCFLAFALWPGSTIDFFSVLLHLDLTSLKPAAPLSLAGAFFGVAGWGVIGFVAGVVFASAYNAFGQH